jgi:hypothetical protein
VAHEIDHSHRRAGDGYSDLPEANNTGGYSDLPEAYVETSTRPLVRGSGHSDPVLAQIEEDERHLEE